MTTDSGRRAPETPFGVRLRAARKMAGLSMEDLAGKLGGLVTKQAISKYEQGQMMPSPEVLERLVEVLKGCYLGRVTPAGGGCPCRKTVGPRELDASAGEPRNAADGFPPPTAAEAAHP